LKPHAAHFSPEKARPAGVPAGWMDPRTLFGASMGALLGLGLCKFGNPVFLAHLVAPPTDAFEWLLTAWPMGGGQLMLLGLALFGLAALRRPSGVPRLLVLAPLPWLFWQWIATVASSASTVSVQTTIHLTGNVACFYLGLYCLGPVRGMRPFWALLLAGYVVVLLSGWQQHFGGLQATREYFEGYAPPEVRAQMSPELVKRMTSDRIFGTLFYPNTLAGAVLLLLPVSIGTLGSVFQTTPARRLALGLIVVLSAGGLVWSGSKAGWLLAVGLGLVALFRTRLDLRIRLALALAVILCGVGGFAWRYSDYLQRGATSAVARFDYWRAALQTARDHPALGSGPGTFGAEYARIKRPESEMARAAHNDYIQQASDSGVPGFLFYTAFVVGTIAWTGRRVWVSGDRGRFWIWLGLLGIALQSMTEFGTYIPAISWTSMTLLGWLLGTCANRLDTSSMGSLRSDRK
jgi:O-antigen ligase